MENIQNGRFIGTERAAGRAKFNTFVKASRIERHRAAARASRDKNFIQVALREVAEYVDNFGYVPHTFPQKGSAERESGQGFVSAHLRAVTHRSIRTAFPSYRVVR